MKLARKIAGGVAALMMMAGSAAAADIPQVMTTVAPPPPPAPTFDWAGPYLGVYGGGMLGNGVMLGVDAGYAFQFGRFVASVEGAIGTVIGGPPIHLSAWGRFGPLVGERLWIYGLAGISNFGPFGEFGGGVAYALRDNLSMRVDVSVYCCWSPVMIKAGLNWHLGG